MRMFCACGAQTDEGDVIAPAKITGWETKPIGDQTVRSWQCLDCGRKNTYSEDRPLNDGLSNLGR
jgi:hypothetical protein